KSFQNYEQSFWNSLEYLIKNISNKESSYLSLVDKISGNFVIIVFSLALISFGIWRFILNNDEMAFKSFISTLIIACPCAIGLAYPLAVNKGIIESVKKNILVKDISVFEKIVKSNFFIFDKTGTITSNNLIIQKINYKKINIEQNKEDNKLENIDSLKDTNLLEDINTLVNEILFISTYKSNHILSKSIHNFIKNTNNLSLYKLLKNYKILDFKEIVSRGIYAKINYNNNFEYDIYLGNKDFIFESIKSFNDKIDIKRIKNEINTIKDENSLNAYFIIIKNNLVFVGFIEYQEEIISKTIELINFLKTNNKEVYILTGASKKSSIFLAKKIGIDLNNVFYEVNSIKKHEILSSFKKKGITVFIGDGINDSLVIKEADVGISFEYGNDLTQNLADVILKSISDLKDFYLISLKTFNKLKFNLFWVFFYNILLVPIAMGMFYSIGILINPMLAAIAMSLSSISLLVFNLF
ncbi:MAG: HAD-IC family P-type ATPase, partial [bacterium]